MRYCLCLALVLLSVAPASAVQITGGTLETFRVFGHPILVPHHLVLENGTLDFSYWNMFLHTADLPIVGDPAAPRAQGQLSGAVAFECPINPPFSPPQCWSLTLGSDTTTGVPLTGPAGWLLFSIVIDAPFPPQDSGTFEGPALVTGRFSAYGSLDGLALHGEGPFLAPIAEWRLNPAPVHHAFLTFTVPEPGAWLTGAMALLALAVARRRVMR